MSKSSQEQSPTAKSTALSTSERHELLATEARRDVLERLNDCQLPIDLDDLACAVEAASQPDDAGHENTDATKIKLHHVHLPKMAEMDVIDYDAEANKVTSYRPIQ
jgi:hypothetical protein